MAQIKNNIKKTYSTIRYEKLKGVDFTNDSTQVSRSRSPDGLNMISDEGGNPVKRRGWEVYDSVVFDEGIDNIWTYRSGGKDYLFVKGTRQTPNPYFPVQGAVRVYNLTDSTAVSVSAILPVGRACATAINTGMLIFNGNGLLVVTDTGQAASIGANVAYIPHIFQGQFPSGGGGVSLEAINMLTRTVKESFYIDPDAAPTKDFVVSHTVNTNQNWRVRITAPDGTTSDYTRGNPSSVTVTGKTFNLGNDISAPSAIGEGDAVEIQYVMTGDSDIGTIGNAIAVHAYSEGTGRRWFVCQKDSNIVRYSALDNYLYWPDNNYIVLGSDKNHVKGFLPVGENLGVIKGTSDRESTLYFIKPYTMTQTDTFYDASGTATESTIPVYTFRVEPAGAAIGAVNDTSIAVVNDEPMFLSERGIYGATASTGSSSKLLQVRSDFLEGKLLKEGNPENAVACSYKNYYVLVVNSHAYVLDTRNKTASFSGNTNYAYEAYYWDNIPATAIAATKDGELFFGTEDGLLCRFKTSGTDAEIYYDDGDLENGVRQKVPIKAVWSTCEDDDNAPQYLKTMIKKGSSVLLKKYDKTSADIYAEVDGGEWKYIGHKDLTIWDDGYNGLAFDTFDGPKDAFLGKKLKKYHRLKIIVTNDTIEPFGIYQITKTIEYAKLAKK